MDAASVLDSVAKTDLQPRTVRSAIHDLLNTDSERRFDTASNASPENRNRIAWLLENDAFDLPNRMRPQCHASGHSYKSMYGRLQWDRPAQTITTGFGSMGQGRFVHPARQRMITPHEAARIQGLPDFYDFSSVNKRTAIQAMIGNAVPPQFAIAISRSIMNAF